MKEIEEFCNEMKAVKYFSNDEAALKALGVEYEIFATRDAAWNAAWESAQGAVWYAAQDAVRYAARDAVRNAAWNAALDAAWGAALQCCIATVCGDLDIPEERRDYASQAWRIWKAGYGVLGRVEDVFYLYEKP